MKKYIGWILVLSPFIGIFILAVYKAGILPTLGVFAFTAFIVLIVSLGVHLIHE